MSEDPIASIRARLQRFKGRYPEISEASGLSYSWLGKFARGDRGERPGFETMRALDRALTDMESAAEAVESVQPPAQ